MKIQNLFPTPIGFFDLDRDFTKAELSFLSNQETRLNTGNRTSLNSQILDHPKMKKVKKVIEDCIDQYFMEVYRPKTNVKLRLTQSWLNYTDKGEWHHKHSHANSIVSGCLYINAKREFDKILFFKEQQEIIQIIPEEYNIWNSVSWWFNVGSKDIVLFPSSLPHTVEQVEHDYTRISLSFNTFVEGSIGCEDSLTHLNV